MAGGTRDKQKYYPVAAGRDVGIFLEWASCDKSVKSHPGGIFKKCQTLQEACTFLNNNGILLNDTRVYEFNALGVRNDYSVSDFCTRTKRPLPVEVALKNNETLSPNAPTAFCDGACVDNGLSQAAGGYGVYWGANNIDNVSERLSDTHHLATNNRAELAAVIAALKQAHTKHMPELQICTDSKYVIDGINCHLPSWRESGELDKRPNKDLWETLEPLTSDITLKWQHVKGHSGIHGNDEADRLANEGARKTASPSPSVTDTGDGVPPGQGGTDSEDDVSLSRGATDAGDGTHSPDDSSGSQLSSCPR
jgi:ribonuclease HI